MENKVQTPTEKLEQEIRSATLKYEQAKERESKAWETWNSLQIESEDAKEIVDGLQKQYAKMKYTCSCKWCGRNLDSVFNKPFEQRKIGDTEECEACVAVPCVSLPSKKDKQETPENRLETPTSEVFKRFVKRLVPYNPSEHDLLVLLFRISTNEGGYTESDLQYMIDKIFGDRDVDAEWAEAEAEPPYEDFKIEESNISCERLCGQQHVLPAYGWFATEKSGRLRVVCKKCSPTNPFS